VIVPLADGSVAGGESWHRQGIGAPHIPLTSHSGEVVTRRGALGVAAFYACVALLARAGGSLPLRVRERRDHREIVQGGDVPFRLRDQPNPHTSGTVFWGTAIQQISSVGNAYAFKVPAGDGLERAPELYLAHPDHSYPYYSDKGELWFYLVAPNGMALRARSEHVLHFKAFGLDGTLIGHSPISLQRHQLGNAVSAQEYQGRMLRQDATPGGVLSIESVLTPEQARTIREQWQELHEGSENQGRIAVLDRGASYQQISLSHLDAQFIEQRELSATEIASMFSIPPSMIGAKGAGFEYKNTNDRRMDFLTFALMPYLRMIEGTLAADKDFFGMASGWEPRFDTREFLRPDPRTRFEMHKMGIESGFIEADEARADEGLPPLSGGVVVDGGE
jgi:HK97 family phage portal protein